MKDNWLIFNDELSLSETLAQNILNVAKELIIKNDHFSIVLTGGRSVLSLYKILSKADSNWDKWHIYLTDERFLPTGHNDRNDQKINETWLNNGLIPKKNIHFIRVELGLVKAQKEYEEVLNKVNKFDIVLLSIGEDGHVSSLFPGHRYPENQNVAIERNSPKPPKERISMSYNSLNNATNIFKIIIGKSKQNIVKRLIEGERLPASAVYGEMEKIFICNNSMLKGVKIG